MNNNKIIDIETAVDIKKVTEHYRQMLRNTIEQQFTKEELEQIRQMHSKIKKQYPL